MRSVLVRWHEVRCLIRLDGRKKKATLTPDPNDLRSVSDADLDRFWMKCSIWALNFTSRRPEWKVNGSGPGHEDEDGDPL